MKKLNALTILLAALVLTGLVITASSCGGGTPVVNPPPIDEPDIPVQPQGYGDRQVLYGDPHIHTILSDGDESPDFAVRYARDVIGLDWCCLTDHSEHFKDANLAGLGYYRTIPEKYDNPGTFCVLFGYEWTSMQYGHRNVYTLDKYLPLLPSNSEHSDNPNEFWAGLEGYECITVAHHPMMDAQEIWWEYTNPMDVAVEFYSKWGLSLREGNIRPLDNYREENGVYRALGGAGLRLGLIAATDTHMTRPGSRLEESRQGHALQYFQPGLTGVWATSFTREALYDALKHRHTYGMTGTKVDLEFSVNDYIMGCEIETDQPPLIKFSASSEEIITKVAVVTIDASGVEALRIWEPMARSFEGEYTDNTYIDSIAYTVRVTLENTDMAIATPVWVDRAE